MLHSAEYIQGKFNVCVQVCECVCTCANVPQNPLDAEYILLKMDPLLPPCFFSGATWGQKTSIICFAISKKSNAKGPIFWLEI